MQALLRTLQDQDPGHLRIIAELWGFDPPQGASVDSAQALSRLILHPNTLAEIYDALPAGARQAIDFLRVHAGKAPFADYSRRYGPLREMGAGRRDRERPWRDPVSPLEVLWYRGLVARAFADTSAGPQEFAFIPEDLLSLLPHLPIEESPPLGNAVEKPAQVHRASTACAEDATTLLANLRAQPSETESLLPTRREKLLPFLLQPESLQLLVTLLVESTTLVGPPWQPESDNARAFLEMGHHLATVHLVKAWFASAAWNDLALVSSLEVDSDAWPNDPLLSRTEALTLLESVPIGRWWGLESFIQAVRDQNPSFQRPAGDFESWYLRDADSGRFLHGFENWEAVDGAFLRTLIRGPLHWLGLVDLGRASAEKPVSAFRLTGLAEILRGAGSPQALPKDASVAQIRPDGRLILPRDTALSSRYQVARITSWLGLDPAGYHFRVTPSSLQAAADQGLRQEHIRGILKAAAKQDLHPALGKALDRWAAQGTEAEIARLIVLRVSNPEVLERLKAQKATARYIGEELGSTAAVVRERDLERLIDAATRLGILIEPTARLG